MTNTLAYFEIKYSRKNNYILGPENQYFKNSIIEAL